MIWCGSPVQGANDFAKFLSTHSHSAATMQTMRSSSSAALLLLLAGVPNPASSQCGYWGQRTTECTLPCTHVDECYDYACVLLHPLPTGGLRACHSCLFG